MLLIRSFIFKHDFHVHSRDQQGLMVNGFHCGEQRKKDPPSVFVLKNDWAISSPEACAYTYALFLSSVHRHCCSKIYNHTRKDAYKSFITITKNGAFYVSSRTIKLWNLEPKSSVWFLNTRVYTYLKYNSDNIYWRKNILDKISEAGKYVQCIFSASLMVFNIIKQKWRYAYNFKLLYSKTNDVLPNIREDCRNLLHW
jgi:hypothetical protein